ncbi:glycoside hydrolase [Plantibacter sp. lyk4-40-MEA-4]|uniref:glycoside hydrolase n=1 Tax=Plantibacter sp. lyk4-40-MEA-4 TaxID=3040298 RepID=UPI00254A34E2|nr:glycoside hydrolase [Plantibacter sp. lyk4-40-MEA-4]
MTLPSPVRRRTIGATVAVALGIAAIAPALATVDAAPAAAAESTPLTITPNPAYQNEAFEGWGTSLVWFANATGDYPEDVRQDLFDKVFGEDGLNLNIARYNIGGGNASDVPPYLRAGGAVDGWWNPDLAASDADGPITSDYADRDRYAAAWDADDPASYDFDADETQRWWLTALKDKITKWEAFSNSPPYFMTESGYASGNFNAADEQLKPESVDDFVAYLTTVVDHLEADTGVDFDTIDPFNEPNTNYWGTQIDEATGWPKGGRQEGAHIGPAMQDTVIKALAERLAAEGTSTEAVIAAMDETNPGIFATNWNGWSQTAKDLVTQLNVHSYGQGGSVVARDIAKTAGKPLWMSEVEGNWDSSGKHNLTNIDNGIGMATHLIDDLRNLEPTAWVLWQPVEDLYNMEKVEKLNWGSVLIDFDCNAEGDSERRIADGDADPSCSVKTNAKYNTLRNFTHYVQPGDHLIPSTDAQTTTALRADGTGATLVHANPSTSARTITIDLSKFADIAPGATVTPIVTTESPADDVTANALVRGDAVSIDPVTKQATLTVPAKSVTTFLVDGATGVAADAAPFQDGHAYQLVGKQSSKAFTAAATTGTVPAGTITPRASDATTGAAQVWTAERLSGGGTNTDRYAVRSSSGALLSANSAGTSLVAATREQAAADPSLQWIPTTTNGSEWSLVNVGTSQALEVGGQSTATGAAVGVYQSNNGANQTWSFVDTALTGVQPVTLQTVAGVPAALPATVVPLYSAVQGAPVPVTWDTSAVDWNTPGTIVVNGSGTDGWGAAFTAQATVDIGGFTTTEPVSLTVAAGSPASAVVAAAPTTVPAQIGASTNRFDTPVTWDFSTLDDADLADTGVVQVRGAAASNDPAAAPIDALLSIIVTAPGERNIAPDATTVASATSTESGYPASNTKNGVRNDKGWSNWRSSNKPASDTLSYELGGEHTIEHVTFYAYKDGSTNSWPSALTVQFRDADGAWIDAPGGAVAVPVPTDGTAPIVDVDLGGVTTSAVRVVMTAYANTHLVVSEVEIYALAPSVATEASLAALRVNGTPVEGFDAGVLEYEVPLAGSADPVVDAIPADRDATVTIEPLEAAPAATARAAADATDGVVITVTAADGVTTQSTTITFARTAVATATLSSVAREGVPTTAAVVVDPEDANVVYAWLLDDEVVDGADTATFTPPAGSAGAALAVRVTVSADGFAPVETTSTPVTVLAAAVDPGTGPGTDPGTNPGTGPGTGSGGGAVGGGDGTSSPSGGSAAGADSLSRTGVDVSSVGLVALLLGLVGFASVLLARRRHSAE